jgi:hypothetical protein
MKQFLLLLVIGFFQQNLFAQQNLFNIPSGEVTPGKKVFFQQQINFNQLYQFSAKSHFVTGLGKQWEAGINLVNNYFNFKSSPSFIISTPFNSKEPNPLYPLLLITAQKRWDAGDYWFFNVGTQAGTNLYRSITGKRFTHFSYGLAGFADKKHHKWKFIAGPYITDWRFVGGGNTMGFLAGTEIKLSEKWLFMMDHISGNNKNSVTVTGLTYNVKNGFQICAGWQIPNPRSSERQALVIEINLFNF